MDADTLLALGRVIGAHGIHGAIKVAFYSGAAPEGTGPGSVVCLRLNEVRTARYTVREMLARTGHFLVRLDQIADRSGAEALVGAEMVVPRGALPEPEEGSYYWADLIGLTVVTTDGRILGELVEILETGSNDVYRVCGEAGEVLVPALALVVRRVDLQAGRMWVDLPEGL